MEDFVKAAVAAGYTSYGVSSHAPLPFATRWTLSAERVEEYLKELERLKIRYADRIELYAGMEIDYLNEAQHPGAAYFQRLPLDYRIGSVHLVYTPDGKIIDTDTDAEHFRELVEFYYQGKVEEIVGVYLDASVRMVEAGGFDFVGHADKITFNASVFRGKDISSEPWFRSRWEDYLSRIASRGLMMEVNTKAWEKRGVFFPGVRHFPQMREMGIAVVVNSDAHRPELIGAGRREALAALKKQAIRLCGSWNRVNGAMCLSTWIDRQGRVLRKIGK